jgi:hypothetical protein
MEAKGKVLVSRPDMEKAAAQGKLDSLILKAARQVIRGLVLHGRCEVVTVDALVNKR